MNIRGYFQKYTSFGHYVKENIDGWPLHTAIAVGFLVAGTRWPMETLLVANTIWWPDREATQHEGYANIWTFHRIMEWGLPVVAGFITYWWLVW